jgi:hypothetical protein
MQLRVLISDILIIEDFWTPGKQVAKEINGRH